MAMALSSSTVTPTIKISPPSTSQPLRFLLRIPSNSIFKNTNLLIASPSHKWRLRISFFPAFLNKGKDLNALKEELLQAIAPLDRGAEATPEDQEMVDRISCKLEAANPIKEPLKSDLLNGKWELIYTTSRSILQTERPKFLRSRTNYQGINVDTLRAQNMESGPFFNQVLIGPAMKSHSKILWFNAVKALLVEIWFERNQRVFHDKATPWMDRFEIARLNASSWCTLSRSFVDYSIQDVSLNWKAFIFPDS